MKLPLSILGGTVLATALFSSLTACSEGTPTGTGGGSGTGTGAAPSAGGSSGSGTSAGKGGSGGQATAGSGTSAGNGSGGSAGCTLMTRADPIGGASGGGGMAAGAGGRGAGGMSGGRSSGGASSGGASSGGMSSGGMSSGGMSSGGMSTGGMSSGGTDSTNPYPPTWAQFKEILTFPTPACTASDCHGLNGPNIFQMTTKNDEVLWNSLSTHVSVQCGNLKVVEPGHPELSAIVKIIKGPCAGPCGITPRMPKDCSDEMGNCLDADMISSIEKWIAMGADHTTP